MVLRGRALHRVLRSIVGQIGLAAVMVGLAGPAGATEPRLNEEDCEQLRADQAKFLATGILDDLERGPNGKTLSKTRLQEIELFITLEEQLKFGCRIYPLMTEFVSDDELERRAKREGVTLPIRRDIQLGIERRRSEAAPNKAPHTQHSDLSTAGQASTSTSKQNAAQERPDEPLPKWSTMGRNSTQGALDALKPSKGP